MSGLAVEDAFGGPPRPPETIVKKALRTGEPLNAVQVELEILRFIDLLEDRTDELAGRAREAAEAEGNHKGRWASEFLQADGTEAKRKAEADVSAHKLFLDRKIKEALYVSTKESLLSIRAQLDALRSISANIRAQT